MLRLAGNIWIHDAIIYIRTVCGVERGEKDGSVTTEFGVHLMNFPVYHWTHPTPAALTRHVLAKSIVE